MNTYLFDFDGTLVDSMPTFVSVMLRVLDEYGVTYGKDIVKIITPLGYHGAAEYFRVLGINKSVDELVLQMQKYAKNEYENKIVAKNGVIKTLMQLKHSGASLNILTASPHSMLDPCLKRIGIWQLFDNIWSCDDFKTTKSNPQIYKKAARMMGSEIGDVVFVDDNVEAIKTAKLAGMRSCGVYDKSSQEFGEEMKKEADYYIESFEELIV